jgi:4-alpha-glucanotransferase
MSKSQLLHDVARLFNVQTVFYDAFGRLNQPPAEAILRVLRILGAPVERMDDLGDALRERRQFLFTRGIEPVAIAWNGNPLELKLRLAHPENVVEPSYHLTLESGECLEGRCRNDAKTKPLERQVEGTRYLTQRVVLPDRLPLGYHRLQLHAGGRTFESHVLSAAQQNYRATDIKLRRWGLFSPLYAFTSEHSWGAGDFSDLESLVDFTARMGGDFIGTLPLLSTFLDEPFNPSPYAPVSRLFWNEFYLDITRVPELGRSPAARAIIESSGFRSDLDRLHATSLIEYRPLMALKRRVLETLLRALMQRPSQRRTDFQHFIQTQPQARDYAVFRAKVERERKPWEFWPTHQRDGRLDAGDYDAKAAQYHLYVQWLAREQIQNVAEKAKTGGQVLYLDFPLGVNRDGYDVWREREVFALGASGGAPPDNFFTKGQNWGFPPLHPAGLRQQGYRYYTQCLRHHLRHAGMLRIDHVMGLHRLYWVPDGFGPAEGVYVHYPAEELYAILSLESHRHRARIVGENLGTVPPYVNSALAQHGIHGMHVSQFYLADPERATEDDRGTVASLNTHDTPTFASFWREDDIEDRIALGLLSSADAQVQRQERDAGRGALVAYLKARGWLGEGAPELLAILRAWLCQLASGDAYLVLINFEDLWLEPLPQNVPGTWEERPNWKRKARFSLEQIRKIDSVTEILRTVDQIRRQKSRPLGL